jgi:hypothetical protein
MNRAERNSRRWITRRQRQPKTAARKSPVEPGSKTRARRYTRISLATRRRFRHTDRVPRLPRSRRGTWLFAGIACLSVFGLSRLHVWPFGGVYVAVKNHGPGPLRNVVVHTTANSYVIGDVGIGKSRSVAVAARGESGVEVEVTDDRGNWSRQVAGCYFETANYHGVITLHFENGIIQHVDDQVQIWLW